MIKKKWVLFLFFFFILLTLIPFVLEFIYPDVGFVPKGDALKQNGPILWAHIATDFLIGIAYVSITLTLLYIVKKAGKSIPFSWVFVMFGLFIIACGVTHFMGVFVVWKPWYWIEAGVQYFTVIVSLGTAIAMVPLTPKVFNLIDSVNISEKRKEVIFDQNKELKEHEKELKKKLVLAKKVKKLKQEAVQLEKINKIKSTLLSMTSHELKTPITPIKGQTESLLAGIPGKLNKKQRSGLQIILRNTDHLNGLLTDLLDSAKLEANQLKMYPEEFDLNDLLNQSVEDLELTAKKSSITFVKDVGELPTLFLDQKRIYQVLVNLLNNAIKFSKKGGKIRVSATKQNKFVLVSVNNKGLGIPRNMVKKIFDKFVQLEPSYKLKSKGAGLGLSICKGIIERCGGRIWVESSPKKGTNFFFTLPLRKRNKKMHSKNSNDYKPKRNKD